MSLAHLFDWMLVDLMPHAFAGRRRAPVPHTATDAGDRLSAGGGQFASFPVSLYPALPVPSTTHHHTHALHQLLKEELEKIKEENKSLRNGVCEFVHVYSRISSPFLSIVHPFVTLAPNPFWVVARGTAFEDPPPPPCQSSGIAVPPSAACMADFLRLLRRGCKHQR